MVSDGGVSFTPLSMGAKPERDTEDGKTNH